MSKRLSTVTAALLASAIVLPALGQIPVPPPPPLPNLEVRVVAVEPPAPRREVILYDQRPGRDYVWINGSYDWEGDGWVWVPGRWDRAPLARAVWVPARWVHARRGWYFVEGHWR